MGSSRETVEIATDLILKEIKSNIEAALVDVRADRSDPSVSTEAPRSYYIYAGALSYQAPAVFVICDTIDFQKDEGANHLNSRMEFKVAVVVEDYDMVKLTKKAWRYQAALHKILDQTQLLSDSGKEKLTLVIEFASFSPEFTDSGAPGNERMMYRKEIMLEVTVRHFEGF